MTKPTIDLFTGIFSSYPPTAGVMSANDKLKLDSLIMSPDIYEEYKRVFIPKEPLIEFLEGAIQAGAEKVYLTLDEITEFRVLSYSHASLYILPYQYTVPNVMVGKYRGSVGSVEVWSMEE